MKPPFQIQQANHSDASLAAELIYGSAHELMEFMFKDKETACEVLTKLYRKKKGHFSHIFTHRLEVEGQLCGIELGYSQQQLARQELVGSISLLLNSPVRLWWHLIFTTGRVLGGYVPKPSEGAYYINNIAVSDDAKGRGYGKALLNNAAKIAKKQGKQSVELDVTSVNIKAIAFYKAFGFEEVSVSGDERLLERYGLPPLLRMRYTVAI